MTESIYFTFVTIGTVGYGDFYPISELGMYFTLTLIIFGIGSFALAIETILSFIIEKNQMKLMGLLKVRKNKHIVICSLTERTIECIKEIKDKNSVFVLVESEDIRKNVIKPHINFVNGNPT